jgi:hypothetical protein
LQQLAPKALENLKKSILSSGRKKFDVEILLEALSRLADKDDMINILRPRALLVLKLHITLSKDYWIAVEWFYPIYSSIAFFIFGRANEFEKIADQPESPHES